MESLETKSVGRKPYIRNGLPLARKRISSMIRERIVSGAYPPGTQLVQQRLSNEFGVGPGSVREALLELEQFGMVESVDHVGVFVASPGPEVLLAAYDVREVVEGLAAREACAHVSVHNIKQFRQIVKEMKHTDDPSKLDREFHRRIITLSKNPVIERVIRSYKMLGKAVDLGIDRQRTYAEHEAIVTALEDNSPAEAERRVRAHVHWAREKAKELFDQGKFKIRWIVD